MKLLKIVSGLLFTALLVGGFMSILMERHLGLEYQALVLGSMAVTTWPFSK